MSNQANICLSGNNSTLQATAHSSDMDYMTSLQIAEITGMRHSDVMRSIRNMESAWAKIAQRNFALGSYTDANNQARPCYALTKTECLYIATKFNDEARARLVIRWEELETEKHPAIPLSPAELILRQSQLLVENVCEHCRGAWGSRHSLAA